MKFTLGLAIAVVISVSTGSAFAQTVYKCKTPSGGTVFSDAPCSSGAQQEKAVTYTAPTNTYQAAPNEVPIRESRTLDAKVAEAIGSGDLSKAKTLALTPLHWQMISEAEQRAQMPVTGRTSADVRAEARTSQECKAAERHYEIEAGSISKNYAQIDAAKHRMYSECGMNEPTNININNRSYR